MKTDYQDLLSIDFVPLYEARARLSEQIKKIQESRKRVAVTINGRPAALLMSYQDYLDLLRRLEDAPAKKEEPIIDFSKWKQSSRRRKRISQSINALFKPEKLSRKRQKSDKRKKLREFQKDLK